MNALQGLPWVSPVLIRRFKVVEVQDDYVVGQAFDGVIFADEPTRIAKPWDLQMSAQDGQSYAVGWPAVTTGFVYSSGSGLRDPTRVATRDGVSRSERIEPAYFPDAQILALYSPLGGTGVSVGGQPVLWLDLNVASRGWVAV